MKLKVLFVDDDENIISAIKRMMYPLRNKWDLYFAFSGKYAENILENSKIDVIITDIRMPGIDGSELLAFVKEKYPQIIRITLSGFANDNLAMRNSRIVHQSLSKPTTSENIKEVIEKAFNLRKKLNDPDLLKIISGIGDLPTLPALYLELENEINSKNSSIEKLSKIISRDPVITAKILQLTNSAFFGLSTRITNITHALNYLGIKLVQNLVLSIRLFRSINPIRNVEISYEDIWNHSNNVAFISQQIAKLKNFSKVDIEDSYLGGLLHDIGKLIIYSELESANNQDLISRNKLFIDISIKMHAEIGAYLLGIWGIPDAIVEAVAFHHNINCLDDSKLNPAKVVKISNLIANKTQYTALDLNFENIDSIINEVVSTKE